MPTAARHLAHRMPRRLAALCLATRPSSSSSSSIAAAEPWNIQAEFTTIDPSLPSSSPSSSSSSSSSSSPFGRFLTEGSLRKAATSVKKYGFAVLRHGDRPVGDNELRGLYSEEDLAKGLSAAVQELERVRDRTKALGLDGHGNAPWSRRFEGIEGVDGKGRSPAPQPLSHADFKFLEAVSYSPGRLDLPKLLHREPFASPPWRSRPDLLRLARRLFARDSEQSIFGALWNFPGSVDLGWHRDGDGQLLVAVTAPEDYPDDIGWMHVRHNSHLRSAGSLSLSTQGDRGDQVQREEAVPLKKGETLLFLYSCVHAGMANLTADRDRCLLYTVYGPRGLRDTLNHRPEFPSLFE